MTVPGSHLNGHNVSLLGLPVKLRLLATPSHSCSPNSRELEEVLGLAVSSLFSSLSHTAHPLFLLLIFCKLFETYRLGRVCHMTQ